MRPAPMLAAFAAGTSDRITARAYEMWLRGITQPRLTRFIAAALFGVAEVGEVPTLQRPEKSPARPLTSWPGWQGLPGVTRARFDGKGGWSESPGDSLGDGRLVVTLPVGGLEIERVWWAHAEGEDLMAEMAPKLIVTDIIACDPHQPQIWARLTKQADMLGEGAIDRAALLAANDDLRALRLHRTPLAWWRAGNGIAGAGEGCCVLSPRAWRRDEVLATSWICDDATHAAEVEGRQKRARAALTSERVPQAGSLAYVERGAA